MAAERVSEAVQAFVEAPSDVGARRALEAVALMLAAKLDAAGEDSSARAASAVPPLARRLVEVLDRLAPLPEAPVVSRDELIRLLEPLGGRNGRD